MILLHNREPKSFYRLLLRGDGWGWAAIRNEDNELEWWIIRKEKSQYGVWVTTQKGAPDKQELIIKEGEEI